MLSQCEYMDKWIDIESEKRESAKASLALFIDWEPHVMFTHIRNRRARQFGENQENKDGFSLRFERFCGRDK